MKGNTARRMAGGTFVPWSGEKINQKDYEALQKKSMRKGKNILRVRHKRERQGVRLARLHSKAWRKKHHG